jgi:hypothetical protein
LLHLRPVQGNKLALQWSILEIRNHSWLLDHAVILAMALPTLWIVLGSKLSKMIENLIET